MGSNLNNSLIENKTYINLPYSTLYCTQTHIKKLVHTLALNNWPVSCFATIAKLQYSIPPLEKLTFASPLPHPILAHLIRININQARPEIYQSALSILLSIHFDHQRGHRHPSNSLHKGLFSLASIISPNDIRTCHPRIQPWYRIIPRTKPSAKSYIP